MSGIAISMHAQRNYMTLAPVSRWSLRSVQCLLHHQLQPQKSVLQFQLILHPKASSLEQIGYRPS